MLESSLLHSKKAFRFKKIALSTQPDEYPFLQIKRSQTHTSDTLRSSQNQLLSLELLVKRNPENQAALDYLLVHHLMNKNILGFFNAYNTYCKDKTNYVPRVYAEALLIYFAAFKIQPETIMEYNINLKIVKEFNEYTQLHENTYGNLRTLQKKYPDSYWLFYHFATLKHD